MTFNVDFDIIVVGAGPAGNSIALEAGLCGSSVAIVDPGTSSGFANFDLAIPKPRWLDRSIDDVLDSFPEINSVSSAFPPKSSKVLPYTRYAIATNEQWLKSLSRLRISSGAHLIVSTATEVQTDGNAHIIHTLIGDITARHVVWATGEPPVESKAQITGRVVTQRHSIETGWSGMIHLLKAPVDAASEGGACVSVIGLP